MNIVSMLILSVSLGFAGEISIKKEDLKPSNILEPSSPVEREEIAVYKSAKLYAFEKQARQVGADMSALFESLGVRVIGVNVFEKDSDYGFSIEYLPALENEEKMASLILKKYESPASYWNRSLASSAAGESENFFSASPLKNLETSIIEGENYSFSILYYVKNMLRKSPVYYAVLGKTELGEFTFESEAAKNSQVLLNKLKNAGFAAFAARPVEKDGKWKVEAEYFYKSDKYKTVRPEYSIRTYGSPSLYAFEKDALREGKKIISNLPGEIFPLAVYAVQKENDWTFLMDYAVKNIYLKEKNLPEYEIKKYFNPENFTFESQAEKAMEEKFAKFFQAGLYPVGKGIIKKDGDYTFYIEYFSRYSASALPKF